MLSGLFTVSFSMKTIDEINGKIKKGEAVAG